MSHAERIRKRDMSLVGKALKEALSDKFTYVELYIYEYSLEIEVELNDIDISESVDIDTVYSILKEEISARKFYKDFGNGLIEQYNEILKMKKKFTTPEKLEEIEETDFLKSLEEVVKDGLNNDNKYQATIIEGNRYRCKGKTTALAYYAMKYNIPVMVDIKAIEKIINRDFPEVETYYFNDVHNRLNFDSLVLVDEMDYDNVKKLVQQGVRVFGFVKFKIDNNQ